MSTEYPQYVSLISGKGRWHIVADLLEKTLCGREPANPTSTFSLNDPPAESRICGSCRQSYYRMEKGL